LWCADGDQLVVGAAPADGLSYAGTPIEGEVRLPADQDLVHCGDVRIEPISRGGRLGLRVRDPHSPALKAFDGIPAYAPSRDWVVRGRFEPAARPEQITVGSVVDGIEHVETMAGVLRFPIDGTEYALLAFDGGNGSLDLLFRDRTSGVTTYPALRFLDVKAPDAEGRAVIDFNRAYNPPCAFTEYATCPLPPPGNVLPVAVTAGERYP
jgi:uncharacterized protein (DUF1684 family)